jgi:hypothetical protein
MKNTKRASMPYNGMATNPAVPPLLQPLPAQQAPLPNAGQQGQGAGMPGMMPPKPPIAAQVAGGGGRQMRGYGNTPLKQTSGTPGAPGRPPVGTKKQSNANCYPMMSVTGPLSGMGPAGIGMKPPTMSAPMSSISGMNSITPNVGAAVKTGNHACYGGKKMKKSVRRIKKATLLADITGKEPFPGQGQAGVPTAIGLGAGLTGFHGASLGAGLGGLAGALHGAGKGNMAEGLGRGVVRGAGTGAGVGIGGLLGGLAGGSLGGVDGAALGGLAGAGLGGYGGWNAAGHLMGESSTDKLKKEKDKTDQAKAQGE